MDDSFAAHLAAACSRSALHCETLQHLREGFPDCKLLRLSFGLQNKVMLSISVELDREGRTHASYVPIHPTGAAAAVLQNNPVVVVHQDKRSPLWDQEDLYQRESCSALSVVSMPFYWPPRAGATWEGAPLPVPQNPAFHPTFGALTAAGDEVLTQDALHTLLELATRTGRHVGPHISMLLSSLEAAELLPSEGDAQGELGKDDALSEGEEATDDLFGFDDSWRMAGESETVALLPGLGPIVVQSSSPTGPLQPIIDTHAARRAELTPGHAMPVVISHIPHAPRPAAGTNDRVQQLISSEQDQQQPAGSSSSSHTGAPQQRAQDVGQSAHSAPAPADKPASISSERTRVGAASGAARSSDDPPSSSISGEGQSSVHQGTSASHPATGNPDRNFRHAPVTSVPNASTSGVDALHAFVPWHNLAFQPAGLERAYLVHFHRSQQRSDLAALVLLVLCLLLAAMAHTRGWWPAGIAATLVFAPYFLDARLYTSWRERLITMSWLLTAMFLSSLPAHAGSPTPNTCAASDRATCAADGRHQVAGFGLAAFLLHGCGLHYLVAGPLLFRLPLRLALRVQGVSLAVALYHLPASYHSVLNALDTAHVLLLGLMLKSAALGTLAICAMLERQHRRAWLARRLHLGNGEAAAGG